MSNVSADKLFPTQLLHSTVLYLVLTDIDGKCIYANPLFLNAFSYTSAPLHNIPFASAIDPDDVTAYTKAIKECIQFPGKHSSVTLRAKAGPGTDQAHNIHWEFSVFTDNNSKHIMCVGYDAGTIDSPIDQLNKNDAQPAELQTEKLRALVNHIPGAIYRCRGDEFLSLEFFSDEVEKLTGYSLDYFMSNRKDGYSRLVHPDDLERLQKVTYQAVAGKEKFEIEYRVIKKNGEIVWVVETGQGVYDQTDKVNYVDGYIYDNTIRKKTEIALAKSEDEVRRLALVARNTTNSVMITDADENITWVNEGYTRISGYTLEEVRGKKIGYSLTGPGFDEENQKRIRKALDNKLPFKEEFISHTKSGEPIWLEVDCHPLKDEKGSLLGFMAIESDITNRKNNLKEQEELVQRLTLATDSAGIGIFEIDLTTSHVIWDDRMYAIYGYPKDTHLSLYGIFDKAVHPDDAAMMSKIIGELLSLKKEINGAVYRIVLPDGKTKYIESHAIIKKSESGRVLSLIGTNRDVTEDVTAHEKIKMQNKVLRDIAFIQSHEVRKPLANILGIIEILHTSGAVSDLQIFDHLVESARELDQQIRSIVSKTNTIDDDLFR